MYDDLNSLINKGEIVKRYYNPCNYFEEIHFLLINQKKIKKKIFIKTCWKFEVISTLYKYKQF